MTLSELVSKLQSFAYEGYALDESIIYDKTGDIFCIPEKVELKNNNEGIVEIVVHETKKQTKKLL